VETAQINNRKPSVVLVYEHSLLRYWLERTLSDSFHVSVFSNTEDALAFVGSAHSLDVLVTDLDLGLSALGGCNIARDVAHRFPKSRIFVFSDGIAANDHRLLILRDMKMVQFLSKFEAVFLARRLSRELSER
jgi:DNA-binding NarL/FixJ family response regulator